MTPPAPTSTADRYTVRCDADKMSIRCPRWIAARTFPTEHDARSAARLIARTAACAGPHTVTRQTGQ